MKKFLFIMLFWTGFSLLGVSQPLYALSLSQAIEDAIINNPEFRQEVKAYQAIEAEVASAKGGYYPVIDLSAGIGYEEVNTPITNSSGLMRRETAVRLTQNLFEGFSTESEIKRLSYRMDAQGYRAQTAANDIALKMAQAYISLLRDKELMELADSNLNTHIKLLDQIEKRTAAGMGNQVEVDQAKARLALAQANFATAKNNYFDARSAFHRVLGRAPDETLIKPKFHYPLPKTLEEATNTALIDHPTMQSANADIIESKMQFKTANRPNYPRIDLEVQKTFDENTGGYKGKNENFQAMIRLRYNLYNGGKDSARLTQTARQYQQATEIRNNTRRQAIENLRYAWNAHKYITEQLEFNNQHIKLTFQTLSGYRKQFSLGRRSLLDLLNTENEYVNALRTLITNESDQLIAKYRILAATGHLMNALDIDYPFIQILDEENGIQ
ncbi:MAG: type I secretion protein TolC [Piscirickettsiaceae bacterium CG_4_9_14_3_um_filter_43_564]|nr:TolC family outer membrane protein [Thiomicrospira sp.]OIP95106.1 MAG: type I secretion protein TolC [Thiomicrospira sp. CG2_30_44_34]PIQ03368.1 MAG: type I secretion protein TolC [Piscirickettsiaceae bacterium CG18_big_fil_WC_8_21_14_2_50_44_103]PIU39164.1 MAG: type I secretion protein TolC [Piscirickettsiaceae bacterium CG07_land_8_20_14_0_80_44_28]PIW56953.1 MAG: type I secretion protein TolC [Piscirickettsiaceae bacterium CG12_big_fil_rev_8_21_14_0_65_44_934]PIW76991.1 MAG: type I secre